MHSVANAPLPLHVRLSDHDSEPEMLGERIKIFVVAQQVITALDAPRGNHGIDGLANGHAVVAQRPEVFRRLNRDFLSAQFYDDQRGQHFPGFIKVSFVNETLQDFGQLEVESTDGPHGPEIALPIEFAAESPDLRLSTQAY
jgi:hypothetical protein